MITLAILSDKTWWQCSRLITAQFTTLSWWARSTQCLQSMRNINLNKTGKKTSTCWNNSVTLQSKKAQIHKQVMIYNIMRHSRLKTRHTELILTNNQLKAWNYAIQLITYNCRTHLNTIKQRNTLATRSITNKTLISGISNASNCQISVNQQLSLLEMAKYINYLKQRYLGFKLQLMLEVHIWRVYSIFLSLLTVMKKNVIQRSLRKISHDLWQTVTVQLAASTLG